MYGETEAEARQVRKKVSYVGAPAVFALERECQHLNAAFGGYGCYLVGSAIERPDWRDVDVRFILSDEEFAALFPAAGQHWEHDPRWLLLTVAISKHLSSVTGLPIDFQFQPQTHANAWHAGPRHAKGLRIAKQRPSENGPAIQSLEKSLEPNAGAQGGQEPSC